MPVPWRASASLVAALLAGCSAGMARTHQLEVLRYVDYAGAPVERFNTFQLDGWDAVARNQLVVWTGVNEAYLLTVWDSCSDLQFAKRVGVSSVISNQTNPAP